MSSSATQIFKSPLPSIGTTDLSFTDYVLEDALEYPERVSLIEAETGQTLSYNVLRERVHDMAIQYYIRGWERGEMLAVVMNNNLIYIITALAAAKVGIPITLVNPRWKSRMMVKQLRGCKTKYIITQNNLAHYVRDACQSLRGIGEILILDLPIEKKNAKEFKLSVEMQYNLLFNKPPGWGALPDWVIKTDEILLYPHGHLGDRGVSLHHGNLNASIIQLASVEHLTPEDIIVTTQPHYHIYHMLLAGSLPFLKGARLVILSEKSDATKLLEIIQQHKVTHVNTSVALIEQIVNNTELDKYDLSTLKYFYISEAISDALLNSLVQKFNVKVKQGYGLPELTCPVMFNNSSGPLGSVGQLLPDTEAKLLNAEGEEITEPNKEGNLYIRGPQLFKEYFENPTLTKEEIDADGFIKTGDTAYVDDQGYWWINKKKENAAN